MRFSRPNLLLTACAVTALAAPALAQDAPASVDPAPPAGVFEEPVAEPAAPPIPAIWAPVPVDGTGQSAYGLYLSGLLASLRGDHADGSSLLARSQGLVPEQPQVGIDAFRASLLAGDLDAVVRISPAVQDESGFAGAGRLAEVVEAMRRGEARSGLRILQAGEFDPVYGVAVRFLHGPVAAAAGEWDAALVPVSLTPDDPATLVLLHQRARLLEARRRYDEAEADYQTLLAVPIAAQLFGRDYADFLKRRGRAAEAQSYYQRLLAASAPEGTDPASEARDLARARPPALPAPAALASDGLRYAAIFLGTDPDARSLVAFYLRLAGTLHRDDEITLYLGQTLAAGNRQADARAVFARVGPENSLRYAEAQVGLGVSFARDSRAEEAIAAFRRALAVAPDQPQILRLLAVQLFALDRPEEALSVIDDPNARAARAHPDVREVRGLALQELGRTEEAEAELWAALQATPDDPSRLNSLGYLWVDTGRRVDQGAEMLARAHAADPANGGIQDSLGWAQFRQGQYEVAVETLEEAVNKQPANAVIVDHLGDAYWQVGRRREAEWQWGRVLTLETDADIRAEVEHKLANGLTVAPPVSAGQN